MVRRAKNDTEPVSLDELLALPDDSDTVAVAELEPEFDLTADVAEIEPAAPAFKASDILEPSAKYNHRDLERLLGIDPQIMAERFGYRRTAYTPPEFDGQTLIAWIDGEGVQIECTYESRCILDGRARAAETAAEDEARRREAEGKRLADPANAILDKAVASIDAAKQGEWTPKDAWKAYVAVVLRLAAGTPDPSDANSLACLMAEDLKLDRAAVVADIDRVRKLQEYRAEVALRGEREEAARQATRKLNELKAEHRLAIAEVVREVNMAQSYADQSRSAVDSLRSLAGSRQELFSAIDPAPVLLGE